MGRPNRQLLSVEIIIEAALKVIALHGDFTIQQLARELGVRQSSLYNHVAGRRHIIDLMRARIFEDIHLPRRSETWCAAVERGARQYHAACTLHVQLIAMLAGSPLDDPAAGMIRRHWTEALVTAGFTPGMIQQAIAVLDRFILGSVIAEQDARTKRSYHEGHCEAPEELPSTPQDDKAFDFGILLLLRALAAA